MERRVLVVDDEPEICAMIERVVSAAGMEALTLTDSSQAANFLNNGKFDLVFLDLHMPSPDGLELARQIRRSRTNRMTPVILISDDQRPSALSIGFEAGASFFLYKPIDKERLLKLLNAARGTIEHERRRMRRIPVRQRVQLRAGAEVVEGETVDMSLSGMLVRAPRTLPAGSSVQLRVLLSKEASPLTALGSIVHVRPGNQMGIHMDHLSPADSEKLQEFLLPLVSDSR